MYAIVEIGNRQYKVEKNQIFLSDKTEHVAGTEYQPKVLLFSDNGNVKVGNPVLSGAKVSLKVIEDLKGKKIRGFKYKRRKNYARTWGHRQELQKVQVLDIIG